jgi:hypothetical protein
VTIADQIAGSHRQVIFKGKKAFTDNNTIVVPELNPYAIYSNNDADILRGYIVHEAAHCRLTDFPLLKRVEIEAKARYENLAANSTEGYHLFKTYMAITNILDDRRIENIIRQKYRGTYPWLAKLRSDSAQTRLKDLEDNPHQMALHAFMKALVATCDISNDWPCANIAQDVIDLIGKNYPHIAAITEIWEREIRTLLSEKDLYDYSHDVISHLLRLVSTPARSTLKPTNSDTGRNSGAQGKTPEQPPEAPGPQSAKTTAGSTSPTEAPQEIETGAQNSNVAKHAQERLEEMSHHTSTSPTPTDNRLDEKHRSKIDDTGNNDPAWDMESERQTDDDDEQCKSTDGDPQAQNLTNPVGSLEDNNVASAENTEPENVTPVSQSDDETHAKHTGTTSDDTEASQTDTNLATDLESILTGSIGADEIASAINKIARSSPSTVPKSLSIADAETRINTTTKAESKAPGSGIHASTNAESRRVIKGSDASPLIVDRVLEMDIIDLNPLNPTFIAITERDNLERASPISIKDRSSAHLCAAKLRPLLMSQRKDTYRTRTMNGSLDHNNITGLALNDPDVFRQRAYANRINTALMLLVDQSHSTIEIIDRLGLIAKNLSDLSLGIPELKTAIATYTNLSTEAFRGTALFTHVRRFDDPAGKTNLRYDTWQKSPRIMDGTPTAEATLTAARHLEARPERRKILITITDGRPNVMDAAVAANVHLQKRGIENCVLEIGDQLMPLTAYDHTAVAQNISEVPDILSNMLKKLLIQKRIS